MGLNLVTVDQVPDAFRVKRVRTGQQGSNTEADDFGNSSRTERVMGLPIADRAILTSYFDQHQVTLYVLAQAKSKCDIVERTRVDVSGDGLDRGPAIHDLAPFAPRIEAWSYILAPDMRRSSPHHNLLRITT